MLHHVSLPVRDLAAAKALYDAMVKPLGYRCVFSVDTAVGYGVEDWKDKLCLKFNANAQCIPEGFHLALAAPSREAVEAFHQAALSKGARCNGRPGLRPAYGDGYFAAFIIDLDGHQIEAVYKSP